MSMDIEKIAAIISIGEGLVLTGLEIIGMIKNREDLTDEDFKALIEKNNRAQKEAEAKLLDLFNVET